MPLLTDGWPSKRCLDAICTLVFHYAVAFLFLMCCCRGQSQVVGPSQPIVVTLGEDIMLPCHLEPAMDVTDMTIEWTRPDLNPRFVHVLRDGVELESKKHPSYVNRTSVSINKLRSGDISLKLYKVQLSDEGKYRCFIPTLHRDSTVELVVGAVSSLTISLMRTDDDKDLSVVAVQCESAGWYPEPEVLWLDGEGKLLSAGPTETVRGPDDLYTVSSRVTVEKRHSNSFTCRVQQRNINHTTETHIQIKDDFFVVLSCSAVPVTVPVTIGLSVFLLSIVAVVFGVFMWRCRKKETEKKMGDEIAGEKKRSQPNETLLMMKQDGGQPQTATKFVWWRARQQFRDEQQRREEAEREVEALKRELDAKNKELEAEVRKHLSMRQQMEKQLQNLKEKKQKLKNHLQDLHQELKDKKMEGAKNFFDKFLKLN